MARGAGEVGEAREAGARIAGYVPIITAVREDDWSESLVGEHVIAKGSGDMLKAVCICKL